MAEDRLVYKPRGVCSQKIIILIKDGLVASVKFERGCEGNLCGISKLVEGMPVDDVIKKLRGIDCSGKGTSCPDQLALALQSYQK